MRTGRSRTQVNVPVPLYPYGMGGQWNIAHVSGNLWQLSTRNAIAQTGAAVTTNYVFPVYHRLVEMEFKHTTAAGVDSTTALTIYWNLNKGGNVVRQYSALNCGASSIVLSFRDEGGRAYPPQSYQFITTGTNTELVNVNITMEVMK